MALIELLPYPCGLNGLPAVAPYRELDAAISAAEESQGDGRPALGVLLCEPHAPLHDTLAAHSADVALDVDVDFLDGRLTPGASSRLRSAEAASRGGPWRVSVKGVRAQLSAASNLLQALLGQPTATILTPAEPPLPVGRATVLALTTLPKGELERLWVAAEAAARPRGGARLYSPESTLARFQVAPECSSGGAALSAALDGGAACVLQQRQARAAAAAAAAAPRAGGSAAEGGGFASPLAVVLLLLLAALLFARSGGGGSGGGGGGGSGFVAAPRQRGGAEARRSGPAEEEEEERVEKEVEEVVAAKQGVDARAPPPPRSFEPAPPPSRPSRSSSARRPSPAERKKEKASTI